MAVPFERIFGDTSELRVIQFLLPMRGYEFNISEISRGSDVSRQALNSVVRKLLKWNVLKIVSKHGNANYYSLNEDSGFIEAFEDLNNCIIEQMLGEDTLAEIANYSLERRVEIQPIEDISQSYVKGWVESPEMHWLRVNLDDRPKIISEKSPQTEKAAIYAGGVHAAA